MTIHPADTATATPRRKRLSEASLRTALRAMSGAGLTVERVVIRAGEAEILCAPLEREEPPRNDWDLEQW
uniref:hypothetical protein n=1 Tax=Stappia sp. TaxID=1870903 RepID=UPI003BAD5943